MKDIVKNVISTTFLQRPKMNAWTRNVPPINDWMIKETVKIARSVPILQKMAKPAKLYAMMTPRLFRKMGNV